MTNHACPQCRQRFDDVPSRIGLCKRCMAERKQQKKREDRNRSKRRNPGVVKAGIVVARAIKLGELMRAPCMLCGATEKVHAHHDNYRRPLDVVWLCYKHHTERHLGLDHSSARGANDVPVVRFPVDFAARQPRHGTLNEYQHHKCRCEPCKKAKSLEKRAYLDRKKASQ